MSKTSVERKSDRDLVATTTIHAPVSVVFEAWRKPEMFRSWWIPASAPIKLVGCEMKVETGGTYRLTFEVGDQTMAFFGRYTEVTPNSKLVWTNEESGADAATITTVTFQEANGATSIVLHDRYPSKEALDEAIASESVGAFPQQFEQLEKLVAKK